MKKLLSLLLAAGLVLSAASAFADAKRLTFATGGTSGVYFPLGGAIGQVISSKSDGKFSVTPQATGASGENMRLVEMGEVDFAIVQNDVADAAYKGSAPFRSKLANVRAIGRLYPEYLHLVASEESGIKSIEQFKGKQVSVGARGSGNEVNCRQIFGFFGLDYKNVEPRNGRSVQGPSYRRLRLHHRHPQPRHSGHHHGPEGGLRASGRSQG